MFSSKPLRNPTETASLSLAFFGSRKPKNVKMSPVSKVLTVKNAFFLKVTFVYSWWVLFLLATRFLKMKNLPQVKVEMMCFDIKKRVEECSKTLCWNQWRYGNIIGKSWKSKPVFCWKKNEKICRKSKWKWIFFDKNNGVEKCPKTFVETSDPMETSLENHGNLRGPTPPTRHPYEGNKASTKGQRWLVIPLIFAGLGWHSSVLVPCARFEIVCMRSPWAVGLGGDTVRFPWEKDVRNLRCFEWINGTTILNSSDASKTRHFTRIGIPQIISGINGKWK